MGFILGCQENYFSCTNISYISICLLLSFLFLSGSVGLSLFQKLGCQSHSTELVRPRASQSATQVFFLNGQAAPTEVDPTRSGQPTTLDSFRDQMQF